mgnify:CR=1 FL=1
MVTLLARLLIKHQEDEAKTRRAYGILCGAVGIFLNVLLFAGKFFAGLLSIARQGIFLIPLSLILPAFIKPAFYGIIAAQPGADLLCILLGVVLIFVNRFKSRNKSLADGKKRPDNRLMQN